MRHTPSDDSENHCRELVPGTFAPHLAAAIGCDDLVGHTRARSAVRVHCVSPPARNYGYTTRPGFTEPRDLPGPAIRERRSIHPDRSKSE